MRNVTRPPIPSSLKNHATRWTNELLNEITRCQRSNETVDDKFYNKYSTDSVKKSLNKMYNNYCCYCESKVGDVDYPHVEHRKPKRKKNGIPVSPFPELTYEWTNLHLSCAICNNSKGTKYDDTNPILDAMSDVDIQNHFEYTPCDLIGIYWWPKTNRGKTTMEHADLNRDKLMERRQVMWNKITEIIIKLNRDPQNPAREIVLKELNDKKHGKFGSMVSFLMDSLLN